MTGGAGFIGSHYRRTLLAGGYPRFDGAQVTVLDKLSYAGNLANLEPVAGSPRFAFIRGDICDPVLLAAVVPGHDIVLNFAAETHVGSASQIWSRSRWRARIPALSGSGRCAERTAGSDSAARGTVG